MSLRQDGDAQTARGRSAGGMGDLYRLCRMLHAYLSAFAFLSLMFFSITGILLNHPEWLPQRQSSETVADVALPLGEIDAALQSPDAAAMLAQSVRRRAAVLGAYQSGQVFDDEALLQFEGPRGGTVVAVALDTGVAEVATRPARLVSLMNDLHIGKNAGPAWRAFIDISAVVFILLSVVGFVLFFSLRFRLRTSLILTGVSLVVMLALFWLFVS